tara:strand:- start:15676 stop:15903 length:228 start_codon:yes stop_codon:yes gene_type:complete
MAYWLIPKYINGNIVLVSDFSFLRGDFVNIWFGDFILFLNLFLNVVCNYKVSSCAGKVTLNIFWLPVYLLSLLIN